MTETLVGVSRPEPQEPQELSAGPTAEEIEAARELVRAARAKGVALTGPDGLLEALTKTVIETALEEEMSDHLGYDKHEPVGRNQASPATASARRPCSPMRVVRLRSSCRGTVGTASSRWSSRSGSVGCPMSMPWCCRCMPRG
jgi:hypothetical protein